MNLCESEQLSFVLSTYGILKTNNIMDANAVILNTCSVRAQAEQKAFSYLGRLEKFKLNQKPDLKIIVVGCMAERLGSNIKNRFKSIDLIIDGTKDINNVALKIINLCSVNTVVMKKKSNKLSEIVRYITIMTGCDNYCSYCIVPFVRGREISFSADEIFNECSLLVKAGMKEVILLGQNVNSYKYESLNFTSLIKKIVAIEDLERIRFMTNHPKDLTDDLINIMATEHKICSHIHLPMQSASNKILKIMNRKYTYEDYSELIKKLRIAVPNVNITTDIIVGFPGETESDFQDTLRAINKIRFGGLYVFKYSPRPYTEAFKMVDDVPLEEKKRRLAIILKESNRISTEIISEMIGSTQEVFVEKIKNGVIEAKTKCDHKVFVKGGNEENLGKYLNIYIKEIKRNSLFGNIL
jgi:tRNA-2-methylthio-N6-dimethylallyladenosine synthase